MEGDGLCLNLTLLHVDFVAAKDDGDVFANANEITYDVISNRTILGLRIIEVLTMPVWNILVGDTRGNIKHDDAALTVDIVAISQTAKLLLACRVPNIKCDISKVLAAVNRRPYECRIF
jgi:hypothetical protein